MPQGRRFVPGQSGNPSGQPKGVAEVREAARAHTKLAMDTLAEVCRNRKASASARVSAAIGLLDRGWGKAVQPLDINDTRPLAGVPADRLMAALAVLVSVPSPVPAEVAAEAGE
ncbi:MAG: hypothetical protein K2X74_00665 [Acetobacteraceae bacterium]|nr:hypothetical protein [Acetobacteraceae bacterium]